MNDFFKHGSRWVRADFHLHTAAADEFNKQKVKQNTYVEDFVTRLSDQGIQLAVVTNHNKFDREEFLALRAAAEQKDIRLFAGVEFSAKDGQRGIHILIVFDDNWYAGDQDDISTFLTLAFHLKKDFDKAPYDVNSDYDLSALVDALDKYNKDYFLVMAHIDQKNGLLYEIKGRNLNALVKTPAFRRKVLAFQKSTSYNKRKTIEREMGRKLALVEGSDNAAGGMDGIGKNSGNQYRCYLKIGAFSFEAVKFALIHHEERVSKEPEQPQDLYISAIEIERGGEESVKIPLNPALNTLIGVRGSGKSTFLEAVRFGLGLEPGETPENYKNEIVRRFLQSGNHLILNLSDNSGSLRYTIRRQWGERPQVLDATGKVQEGLTPQKLLPTAYYGQKDIEELGKNFNARYVEEKLLGEQLTEAKAKEAELMREIADTLEQLKKISDFREQQATSLQNVAHLEAQIKVFETSGLQELVAKELNFLDDESKLQQVGAELREMATRLIEVIQSYGWESYLSYQAKESGNAAFFETEVFPIIRELAAENLQLGTQFSETGTTGNSLLNKWAAMLQKFNQRKESLQEEFRQAKKRINNPNVDVEAHKRNKQALTRERTKLQTIEAKLVQADTLERRLIDCVDALQTHRLEMFAVIKRKIEQLNAMELPFRIELTYRGDKKSFKDWFSQNANGIGMHKENHIKRIVDQYEDPIQVYKDLYDDAAPLATILQGGNLLLKFRESFSQNPGITYRVPDRYQFFYNQKPLENYSIGQKSTALIAFVLAHEEKKLFIIDQPEDDLDNYTVAGEIIDRVKKLKPCIQFIFATHNPNILVLGDSEQVIICQYHDDEQRIEFTHGSIDKSDIQQTAINIMEGGKEAFDRRKNVYQLWTH